MLAADHLRDTKIPLNNGSGAIPALGFGTLIPDPMATKNVIKVALEAGFRQLDTSERYRNETEVGEAMQEVFKARKSSERTTVRANHPTGKRSSFLVSVSKAEYFGRTYLKGG